MVKDQEMRLAMTTILRLMMGAIQIEHKLKCHGYDQEAPLLQKMNEHFAILQLGGIQIMI